PSGKSPPLVSAVPRSIKRGASRSSRTLGAGCDGRGGDARRAALLRTAKSCGPGAPTLALRSWSDPRTTVAKEPGHRGEHEISRKTVAQGMSDCFGVPVVTLLVCFFHSHTRLRVRSSHPHS